MTGRAAVEELVLVLPRPAVPGGTAFHGLREADADALRELRDAVRAHGTHVERSVAERDASFKQLIPYVVVRDGQDVFLMHRTDAGGDARLHGRASIGVGGHLNPVDGAADALTTGLRREWDEELEADWEPEFRLVGMLNDDTDPVGSVHLGVVFTVDAHGRTVAVRERQKLVGAFAPPAAVIEQWDRLETWSRLVAAHLFGLGR